MEQTLTIPTADDYPELTALWEASVRATHHFLTEEDIRYFRPLILHDYLKAVQLICIRDPENGIAGFCGLSEDTIEMLFVRPDYFGKGIGKKLMQEALRRGIRKVDVNEQNPGALAFYKHAGFRVKSRSPLDPLGKPYPILHLELENS